MTTTLIIILLVTFVISSFIKGWSGYGTNLIAMPLLAALAHYQMDEAVIIVVTTNMFMNVAILIENKKFNLDSLKDIKVLVLFGIIFTFIGAFFLKNPDNANAIKIITGSIIVFTGLYKIFVIRYGKQNLFNTETMHKYYIPAGIISGIFNGIAGLGGLPLLILLSNSDIEKEKFRTTLVSYFLVLNIVAIISYITSWNYSEYILRNISIVAIPSVIAAMFGIYVSRRVSDKIFSRFMLGILIFMGANLIVNGIFGTNILSFLF